MTHFERLAYVFDGIRARSLQDLADKLYQQFAQEKSVGFVHLGDQLRQKQHQRVAPSLVVFLRVVILTIRIVQQSLQFTPKKTHITYIRVRSCKFEHIFHHGTYCVCKRSWNKCLENMHWSNESFAVLAKYLQNRAPLYRKLLSAIDWKNSNEATHNWIIYIARL